MQVVPSGGQICNQCKWRHLVAKFATYASGAIWWPNLHLMQVASSGGQICNKCKWCHVVAKFNPSYGDNFWVRCASGNVCLLGYWMCHLTVTLLPSLNSSLSGSFSFTCVPFQVLGFKHCNRYFGFGRLRKPFYGQTSIWTGFHKMLFSTLINVADIAVVIMKIYSFNNPHWNYCRHL